MTTKQERLVASMGGKSSGIRVTNKDGVIVVDALRASAPFPPPSARQRKLYDKKVAEERISKEQAGEHIAKGGK